MTTKKTPTNNILDLTCLKDFDFDKITTVILPDSVNPDFIFFLDYLVGSNFEVLYEKSNSTCPHCGCTLNKGKMRKFKPNKINNVRKREYKCSNKKCCKTIKTDLSKFMLPNSNYTRGVRLWGIKLDSIGDLSYYKKSELYESFTGHPLPKSTLFEHQNLESDDYIYEENRKQIIELGNHGIKPSGDYHFDEQYPKQNKEQMVRLDILDAQTKYPYYTLLIPQDEFNQELIETYWHTVLDNLPQHSITTDGYKAYDKIVSNFNLTHHRCVFHIMQNTVNDIIKLLNKYLRHNKSNQRKIKEKEEKLDKKNKKYKPQKGRIADEDTKRRKLYNQIQEILDEINTIKEDINKTNDQIEEIRENINKISEIFKSNKISTAKSKLTRLRSKMDQLPPEIVRSINRIYKNFEKLTNHIEDERIPNTNNLIELYFGTTLPKHLKRRYRTTKGLSRRLNIARIRWIHRNVFENDQPIVKLFERSY